MARATPPGAGAVAIVRCSGPRADDVLRACFPRARRAVPPARVLTLGEWRHPADGEAIDTVLVARFEAPASYTGEATLEIFCHGGSGVTQAVVDSCLAAGARPAAPGEFTRRAFLNGKMDLAEAEGVADLVAASARRARRLALRQTRGELSLRLGRLREGLIDLIAEIEARLDFPEDDLDAGAPGDPPPAARLEAIGRDIDGLLRRAARGRLEREGARVVVAGAPNAGKSSLFNALAGRERSIVSPHPGTTRDTVETTLELGGYAITLVDTAGLRAEGAGEIERLGITRTLRELEDADLILWLRDLTAPPVPPPSLPSPAPWIRVGTKLDRWRADAPGALAPPDCDGLISSATGEGLARLEALMLERLGAVGEAGDADDALVGNRRHAMELEAAARGVEEAGHLWRRGESPEFAALELRSALHAIGRILGADADEAILDAIFSRFCIGK